MTLASGELVHLMSLSDKSVVALNFNPKHDKSGRFGSGSSTTKVSIGRKLNSNEQDAVNTYIGDGNIWMNKKLRETGGKIPKGKDKFYFDNLDSAMVDKVKANTTLYRGTYADLSIKKGQVFIDHGYGSSTFNKTQGKYYSDPEGSQGFSLPKKGKGKESYLFAIKVPKGNKGLQPSAHKETLADVGEHEFILPRNSKYKVTKVTKNIQMDKYVDKPYKYTLVEANLESTIKNELLIELDNGELVLIRNFKSNDLMIHPNFLNVTKNEFDDEAQGIIAHQQGALQNAIVGIEARVTNSVLNKVTSNKFDDQSEVMNDNDKKEYEKELALAIAAFYTVILPLFAKSAMSSRLKEFGLTGNFKLNKDVKIYIKSVAGKASTSHINTIINDLLKATKNEYDRLVHKGAEDLASAEGRAVTDADLVLARKKALQGASQQEIVKAIKNEYAGNIAPNRAKAIARTETNRAFTQSQYQADVQFIEQNNLQDRAYKQWVTRSDNPCPICQQLASEPPIPFNRNFADLGDTLKATYRDDMGRTKVLTQLVNFEALEAGNAHVNCSCIYKLVIR